jgi:SAV_6107-like HEPN
VVTGAGPGGPAEPDPGLPDPQVPPAEQQHPETSAPQTSDPETSDPETSDEDSDMTAMTLSRPPAATLMLLDRCTAGLLQACAARSAAERYVAAHLAALRAAAAVLAARGRPAGRSGPRSVWEVLPRIAPELTEWSAFFAATATRRAAVEAGRGDAVSVREADDLLRDAEAFMLVVNGLLGLPQDRVLPDALPSCG